MVARGAGEWRVGEKVKGKKGYKLHGLLITKEISTKFPLTIKKQLIPEKLRLPGNTLGPTVSRSSQTCLRSEIGVSGSLRLTACGPWFVILNFLEHRKNTV